MAGGRWQLGLAARGRWPVVALVVLAWLWMRGSVASGVMPEIRALSSLVVARPGRSERGARLVAIEAARGEWESYQVILRAASTPISSVSMRGEPLVGPQGSRLEQHLAREAYVNLAVPSNVEGAVGPFPDPLIPDVDLLVREPRNAFPVDVGARRELVVWVDVFVPRSAPPGDYRGAVVVQSTFAGVARELARLPVQLRVHRFLLPPTSSLPVTFGFVAKVCARAHGDAARAPSDLVALGHRYALAALRNRISLHGGTFDPPDCVVDASGAAHLDTRAYDEEVAPFLDGTADPGGPAEGARWTAFDLRLPFPPGRTESPACLDAVTQHYAERGWLARAFDFTADEPSDAAIPTVRARADAIAQGSRRVPRLVTRGASPLLDGAVDIWCPIVNLVDEKPASPWFGSAPVPRRAYDARLARGERLWWYQACLSHGCDIVGGPWFTGWPSYAIDGPAVGQRVLEWLSFRHEMGGELYYNTVEAYDRGDPLRDISRHGGNGDGTLFYPGRASVVGGHTDIPLESIRLKRIRDGLEDYEYLTLLARLAGRDVADHIAATVAEHAYRWQHDPARLSSARAEIARRLDALTPGP